MASTSPPAALGPSADLWPTVGPIHYWIGRTFLWVFGWKTEGGPPPYAHAVFVAAPHTTNWDLPFMLAVAWSMRLAPTWFGKEAIFRFPFGSLSRFLGGIPIDRTKRHDYVRMAVDRIESEDRLYLVVSPPGTRKRTDSWKSGFYNIAKEAKIPICCGFLDFRRKVGGIGPTIIVSGDVKHDMKQLRAFYQEITPLYPDRKSEIRLAIEDGPAEPK